MSTRTARFLFAIIPGVAVLLSLTSCEPLPKGLTVAKAGMELRFDELRGLAKKTANSEGNDAYFSEVTLHGTKTMVKNAVITFSADGLTVASSECTIEDGRYTFQGTPVAKGPKTWMIGDQETLFILSPQGDQHYKLETRGVVSKVAR